MRPAAPVSVGRRRAVWLFAYGSLLWEGGLARFARFPALLRGYHRALCIYSQVYRGTKTCPGLVLGLIPGGSCRGLAYRIPGRKAQAVLRRVAARENVTGVYVLRPVRVRLFGGRGKGGRRVRALAFVADRDHPQYAGRLPPSEIRRRLRQGKGTKGTAAQYLAQTVRFLREIGIRDRALERTCALVGARNALRARP